MRAILCCIVCLMGANAYADCQSALLQSQYNIAIKHAEQSITESKAGYQTYLCLGQVYQNTGRFQDAIHYLKKAIPLANSEQDKNNLYFDLSVAFKYTGDLKQSLAYINKKLAFDRRTQNSAEMGVSLATKAAILGDIGRHNQAIELSIESIQYLERDTDRASTYNNIATGYSSLGDFRNAFKYINLAIAIDRRQAAAGQKDLAIHLMNKAYLYRQQGEYQRALATINESLNIIETQNHQYWLMSGLIHRAKTHELSQNYDHALLDFQNAAGLAKTTKAQELHYLLSKVDQMEDLTDQSSDNKKLLTQLSQ
ncbi:tetratricopeptide repeat protein [Pseudoteredinibacter isoporae]|uniref:tetratricopeptide repeat protein n=1 Tax=Pseudoteredinibacter isoporae TaxID=570281 RepID=UPI003107077E